MDDVYITRDTCSACIEVWPAYDIGIRKFHEGCIEYGAAWKKEHATLFLNSSWDKVAENINEQECRKRFGFYPGRGTAWLIEGKKRTKQDLAFSP